MLPGEEHWREIGVGYPEFWGGHVKFEMPGRHPGGPWVYGPGFGESLQRADGVYDTAPAEIPQGESAERRAED